MAIHFEELWEQCEQFHKDNTPDSGATEVLDELTMKIALYKALTTQKENLPADFQEVRSRTLGEILLTITNLSLRENINVYDSLTIALHHRSVKHFAQKYKP